MKRLLEKFSYRGPDGSGMWRSEKVLFGHRRLSIIDLSTAGAQPFVDEKLKLAIIFNGEIYNYQELRSTLGSLGYTFYSQSDTEVLLYAYHQYGAGFLSQLRGMFAFCIYDWEHNKAVLARDPAGEKPLYVYRDEERLVFSSEIKTLHAFPDLDLSIDRESVKAFFALQYIPGPHTVYQNVKRLPAGSALEIELDTWNIRESRYWSLEQGGAAPSSPDEIDALISESVRYRLIADVEVGLLLSGGIDSALLAAYAHKNGKDLRTFTARFEEEGLDESRYARQVADRFGLQQITITGGQLTPEIFDRVIFHGDELLGDPACVPTFMLSQEISKHVKVVLSGEGADELFWGYDTYRYEKIWQTVSWLRRGFSRSARFQNWVSGWETAAEMPASVTRLGKLLAARHELGASRWTSVFADHTLPQLLASNGESRRIRYLEEMEDRLVQLGQHMDPYAASLSGDLLYWLTDDLLMKVDRMTMAHSVEARAPYLDPQLIVRALALPGRHKINGTYGKIVLRKLLEKYIPGDVGKALAWRPKHGFEVPVNSWLRNQLDEVVEDRLSPGKLSRSGLLDTAFVTRLKKNFHTGNADTSLRRKMWMLLCFQSWYEMHEAGFGFR
jgi:asparagine synthase (glutamine-hydrolysing)